MSIANTPPFLASLLFAPGQHPHSIGLVVVPTLAEMQAQIDSSGLASPDVPEAGGGPPRAACCFDHDGDTQLGFVIFAEEALTPELLVHELTHAAMFFVQDKVMASAAVRAKTEDQQSEYYFEACARTVEPLFSQAAAALYDFTRKT